MRKLKFSRAEKRKFLRLDSVFPVEFQLAGAGQSGCEPWHQGFTSNVSKGGICLEFLGVNEKILNRFMSPCEVRLNLRIHIPFSGPPALATGKVAWFKEDTQGELVRYAAGLKYEQVAAGDSRRVINFAYGKLILPRLALAGLVVLFMAFVIASYKNFELSLENFRLVRDLAYTSRDASLSRDELLDIIKEKAVMEEKLERAVAKVKSSEEELSAGEQSRAEELQAGLSKALREKAAFDDRMTALKKQEEDAAIKLRELKGKKMILEKANFEKMYQWIKIHQNNRTGLVASFEGDDELGDQAFTYDQALAVIVFSYFKDYALAEKILNFYQGKSGSAEGFYNGYYASTGEPCEFIVHSGPNLWLGIAILQYSHMSGDKKYLPMAGKIARSILKLQNEDAEKGLRGGPSVGWYATEHNLDAFAFLKMFYEVSKDPLYMNAAQDALSWLKSHAYDSPQVPIKRGRGDATIATDTYAWSIASLGPARLVEMGMDPEAIMKFAEDNCSVAVEYRRPEGFSVSVSGFDFAKQRHVARGGVVSCEWTAQMVLSYRILSRYFALKSDQVKETFYMDKAEQYLGELTKMVISSPSRTGQGQGCLPYASVDFVDTGHGWMTPKGRETGSVSATVYTIFAYYGFNPLEINP